MSEYAIATSGLTRRFGETLAVDDLDLAVPCGSVYGFLGPNGAGKTTTIRMLLGLIRPTSGQVMLLGQPLDRRHHHVLRSVGSLVESPSLYPHLTGWENVEVTRRLLGLEKRHISRVLEIVGLTDAADMCVAHYSLGMRQRLGLALTLLAEPELLLLDEPTNGLDPAGMREVRDLVVRLAKDMGITILLSSHLLGEVEQMATHIGIIQQARLLYQGKLEGLHAHRQPRLVLCVSDATRAQQILRRTKWQVEPQDQHCLSISADNRADAALINQQLVNAGIGVYSLQTEEPKLEEIYMSLTEAVRPATQTEDIPAASIA